jgi:hypothetical protein
MRMRRGAVVAVLAVALSVGSVTAAPAAAAAPAALRWSPALDGEAAGVDLTGGTLRRAAGTRAAELGKVERPGLLTLPARRLGVPVDRVEATVTGSGTDAVDVDVRGLRAGGGWTEWIPAEPAAVLLPVPATEVQARVVLLPDGEAEVRGLTLTAHPAQPGARRVDPVEPAVAYRIFATREGLVGGTTANGHVITERDLFVALPSRRALSPRGTGDYSVKVCAPDGRCAVAPVWDVGPWNTRDDYWSPSGERQNWSDLPQGLPQAQAAKENGHNGGKDQFGRTVRNPAGIDLADGLFWDALGLTDNAWVTVEYLWTGHSPLATIRVDGRVDLRRAPDPVAEIVGLVADRAAVPVECRAGSGGTWLRIGVGQFLPLAAVARGERPRHLPTCPVRSRIASGRGDRRAVGLGRAAAHPPDGAVARARGHRRRGRRRGGRAGAGAAGPRGGDGAGRGRQLRERLL